MCEPLTRRQALQVGLAGMAAGSLSEGAAADALEADANAPPRPYLTPEGQFRDVSRGNPLPHKLQGEALVKAGLTPETWRLEIFANDPAGAKTKAKVEKPLTLEAGNALDLPALMKLGEKHTVRYLKAMQCQNIAYPLGQGLWEGVPLREVLKLCGRTSGVRRIYYWGYHNDKPEQLFRSSLALSQVLDTPPGELPPFLAYRFNGGPVPLVRGGPVRMVVPWAHGFKSIKWLQKIALTYDHQANDTYADQGNDPESYLKTAAYFDDFKAETFTAAPTIVIRGTAMVGWSGLERVEYWLRPATAGGDKLAEDDPAWATAQWQTIRLEPPAAGWDRCMTGGTSAKDVFGFDAQGQPKEWPQRYSVAPWTLTLKNLTPGKYELRVRTVDKNGYAQPEPRSGGLTGKNPPLCKIVEVR